jgi:hypothetical protein
MSRRFLLGLTVGAVALGGVAVGVGVSSAATQDDVFINQYTRAQCPHSAARRNEEQRDRPLGGSVFWYCRELDSDSSELWRQRTFP